MSDDKYVFKGRRMITTDETEVTSDNILRILTNAITDHNSNRIEIQYLWDYYRGVHPILDRVKEVRPEINNKICVNRAMEIVEFHTGYLLGEPIQYIARGDNIKEQINNLNEFVFAEEKSSKDKELADWMHICGLGYRMVLPDSEEVDESPFEIYTLDPRNTFVVRHNGLGNKTILGVRYVTDSKGVMHYSCYSRNEYWEITNADTIVKHGYHILGQVPIVEYPLNSARIGAFEPVLDLLDSIDLVESNRVDGLEQFIQALLLFHNVDISETDFRKLRDLGAIKFKDIDPQLKAEITYLTAQLSQGETQVLVDHLYQTVLTICAMPNRNGGSSTSDTGTAVIYRDGWSAAEGRAKNTELMFKKSEKVALRLILNICDALGKSNIKVSDVEIRFTRRNYENILSKVQVLIQMLDNPSIHDRLAFDYCGIFPDSGLAYTMSMEYKKEQEEKMKRESEFRQGDDPTNRTNPTQRESSGTTNGEREDNRSRNQA